MRLDKYLCKSSDRTRTKAKQLILYGKVSVNGAIVKNAAQQVSEHCLVAIEGKAISLPATRYIMLHKPADSICSNIDEVYPSVLHFIALDRAFELAIAGRLDADTTGLVLVTDDGQWAHRITSPRKHCAKRYRVWLAEPITSAAIAELAQGVQLHGEKGLTKPAKITMIDQQQLLIAIEEGKYHQVKRMFAAVGNKVMRLHREQVGAIELDADLMPGQWRYLTAAEVASV